jgi:TonB family protein
MPEPKSLNRSSAARNVLPEDAGLPETGSVTESNLAELAALFAANKGGSFSADLALEVVLHEIVEQACLATGATGAAIVLVGEGEMVCRASSGSTAPELGARLDSGSGITGECLRSLEVQRCDDAQADPRADMEASRRLGIRSVMVLPLLRDSKLAGVFEVFSTRASAFGERDERTLEALARRVVKNLESADEPPSLVPGPSLVATPIILRQRAEQSTEMRTQPIDVLFGESSNKADSRAVDVLTWGLGLTVLACVVLLGVIVVERLGWMGDAAHGRLTKATSGMGRRARVESPQGTPARAAERESDAHPSSASVIDPAPGKRDATSFSSPSSSSSSPYPIQPSATHKAGTQESVPPPGSLMVYENGREVFRLPPSQGQDAADKGAGSGVQLAASVDHEGTIELSPAAAEDSLVHRVEPEYPEEALQQKIQGSVVLEIHIGKDGAVQEMKLISGSTLLARVAMDAVKQWRFKPRKVHGHFAEMQTKITLNFKLPD